MSATSEPRLTWFLHFRKAAGTSVVRTAEANGERFAPGSLSAMPVDEHGKVRRLWELSPAGLGGFVDGCLEEGTTFVATEWGVPDLEALSADGRVRVVTVLRDPVERMVSNFVYDRENGAERSRTVLAYCDRARVAHSHANYYTKLLLRHEWRLDLDPAEAVALARRRLGLVDDVVALESPGSLEHLGRRLGWTAPPVRTNVSGSRGRRRARRAATAVRHGRLDHAVRLYRPPVVTDAQRAELARLNHLDVALHRGLLEAGA